MSHRPADHDDRPPRVPAARQPQREVGIRELRNAGKVVAELAGAGAVGRVTSGGRLVGWLVPATPAEQRADELESRGKLRRGRPAGLTGRSPLPQRADVPPLSATLEQLRREEDR
jgi:antitoxin (DNA-binding transcriptional repressor) of toxin-antitoxin stability system